MDVWQDTTRGDRDVSEQFVELLIVSDSKLDVAGNDTRFLVVASSVSGKLKDLGAKVLEHSSKVDRSSSTSSGSESAFLQVSGNTTNGELESSLGRSASALSRFLSSSSSGFSFSRHVL